MIQAGSQTELTGCLVSESQNSSSVTVQLSPSPEGREVSAAWLTGFCRCEDSSTEYEEAQCLAHERRRGHARRAPRTVCEPLRVQEIVTKELNTRSPSAKQCEATVSTLVSTPFERLLGE